MAGFEFLGTLQGFFTTLGLLIGSVVGSYFVFRGKRGETQVQARQITEESTSKFLDGQMEFQKYVDEAVRVRVEEATSEMRLEIADLAQKLTDVKSEYHRQNDIIRARETRLWMWDNIHDREGPMPLLPDETMHRLNIGHLINLSAFAESAKMDHTPTKE